MIQLSLILLRLAQTANCIHETRHIVISSRQCNNRGMNEQQKPGEIPDKSVRPSSEPQLENENKLPKLHTMKQDAARYLKDRNISFLDLVSKEHESAQERAATFEYRERVTEKAWFRGVLGLVFLALLAALGYGAYVFLLTTENVLPDVCMVIFSRGNDCISSVNCLAGTVMSPSSSIFALYHAFKFR